MSSLDARLSNPMARFHYDAGPSLTTVQSVSFPWRLVLVVSGAFAVVVIGGRGSIEGAMIGSVIVGIVRAATVHILPEVELFVIYGVMALVLAFRPLGLLAGPEVRKI